MRVLIDAFEYTLYMDADGAWVMHTYQRHNSAINGYAWVESTIRANERDPFKSRVEYDAWR